MLINAEEGLGVPECVHIILGPYEEPINEKSTQISLVIKDDFLIILSKTK